MPAVVLLLSNVYIDPPALDVITLKSLGAAPALPKRAVPVALSAPVTASPFVAVTSPVAPSSLSDGVVGLEVPVPTKKSVVALDE